MPSLGSSWPGSLPQTWPPLVWDKRLLFSLMEPCPERSTWFYLLLWKLEELQPTFSQREGGTKTLCFSFLEDSSAQFIRSVVSGYLWPHRLQHTRPPCPSPTPRVYSNSCPLSRWCHPSISSSVVPFSSCLQSFPASGSFQMRQLFTSGSQSVGVSATTSVLPMNILRGHLPLTKCYMRPCPLHKQYWKTMNTSPVLLQVMICSIQSLTHAFISGTLTKCLAHTS